MFLSYFKSGIFYLQGGVESGFKHVEPKTYEHQLYIVKGKRYPRVWTVQMHHSSLNEGDVFILDLGMKLFFWPGKEANIHEKHKGMEIMFNIKSSERGGHPEVFHPRDGGSQEIDDLFWNSLGGKPDKINEAIPDENAEEGKGGDCMKYNFYKVSNETGKLVTTEITDRPLKRSPLDTNDTFILELHNKIYVWVGKKANLEEKKSAMKIAKDFITEKQKPAKTQISRLPENGEDSHFKSFFNDFYPPIKQDYGEWKQLDTDTHANQDLEKVANKQRQAKKALFDKLGTDYKQFMYHVENEKPVAIKEEEWGFFFGEELYIVDLKGKKHRYVTMWMGPKLNPE